jgi:hypothetical protein
MALILNPLRSSSLLFFVTLRLPLLSVLLTLLSVLLNLLLLHVSFSLGFLVFHEEAYICVSDDVRCHVIWTG